MSLLTKSAENFRKDLLDRYSTILLPTYKYGCGCSSCMTEEAYMFLTTVPKGWRLLLDELLNDLRILYNPTIGVWRLKHQGIAAVSNGFCVNLVVQNSINKKQHYKTKTYAHGLIKAVNKRCKATCIACGKNSFKTKFFYDSPWPVCKKHTKIKSIPT